MRILIATPLYPPDIGGPATYAKILRDELPKRDVSVDVVSYGAVRHLPKGIAHMVYAAQLFRAIPGHDLVLALDPVSVGFPALLAALLWRKKIIVRIAGDYAWEQGRQRFGVKEDLDEFVKRLPGEFSFPVKMLRLIQTFVARHADGIIVPSNYLQGIVVQWACPSEVGRRRGIAPEKITVIYNAFEGSPNLPLREHLRKDFGFSGKILLSAGRLVPWKGFSALISLMPEIRRRYPDCKLSIAGSGPLAHELKTQISKEHLGGAVTLLGDVPRLQLLEYVHAADCFVLNTGYEGLSHQLLEVLAIGTPIVTTNVGGNPELIENGVTGALVQYNDQVGLQNALEEVLKYPERAARIADQGKKFVAKFTVQRMVEETRSLLQQIITHS